MYFCMKKIQGCVNKGMQAQQTFPERIKVIYNIFSVLLQVKVQNWNTNFGTTVYSLRKEFLPHKMY